MKINQTLRNQLIAFFCLSALALLANWTYEYEFYVPSTAENRSIFETLPAEVGRVTYWAAGWPIKYYYKTEYQGLPALTAFNTSRLLLNLLGWSAFVAFFVFYESHLKKIFAVKSSETQSAKSRMSLFDLFTITALIAAVLVYWRWQEGICAGEAKLANEITTLRGKQKGTVSRGVFLPRKLHDLPDYIRLRFQRLIEVNLENPPPELVEKAAQLPYLVRLNVTGGNYDLRKLNVLREKPFLRSLRVAARKVDPEFISLVGSLHQVEVLNLMRTNITSQAIQALGDLPRLRHFTFLHTDVKLSELGNPGFAKTVRFLETGHPEAGITDELKLDNWPELLQLSVVENEIRETVAPISVEITNLPLLRQIILDTLAVYDLKLDNLPELQKIDPISYQAERRHNPDGDGAKSHRLRRLELGSLPRLSDIKFFPTRLEELVLTDKCEASLLANTFQWDYAPKPQYGPRSIPKERLEKLISVLSSENGPATIGLPNIDLRGVDLSPLVKNPRLRYLNLDNTRINDQQLLQLRGAPYLQEVRLKKCNLSGNSVTTLIESLPSLKAISCEARTVGRIKLENRPQLIELFGKRILPVQPIDALKLVGLTSLSESFDLPRELFYLHIEDMPAMSGLTTCGPWPDKAVFKGVRDLNFFTAGGPKINDAVFEELLQCPNLQSLTLAYTSITPTALAKLGQFTKLKYLALTGSQVDDSVVAAMTQLSSLQTLRLDETKVTDQAMDTIQQYKQLSKLYIGQTAITDRGLGKLLDNKQLEVLDCSGLPLGDEANRTLASLDSLRQLNLSNCQLKPATLNALYGLRWLRMLELDGSEVAKRNLMDLARQLPDLRFSLVDANVDQEAMLELASINRVASEWDEVPTLSDAFEVAHERAVIVSGDATYFDRPLQERREIDPRVFSPEWTPPTNPGYGMGGNVMLGQGEMELRQQMLLQRQQAMQIETEAVEMPSMEPMSFPEAMGYMLGQAISSIFSSGTSY